MRKTFLRNDFCRSPTCIEAVPSNHFNRQTSQSVTSRRLIFVSSVAVDVDDVKFVINYDFPSNIEDYVHRIGRTGRSNNKGTSYTFFTQANGAKVDELVNILNETNQVRSEANNLSASVANSILFLSTSTRSFTGLKSTAEATVAVAVGAMEATDNSTAHSRKDHSEDLAQEEADDSIMVVVAAAGSREATETAAADSATENSRVARDRAMEIPHTETATPQDTRDSIIKHLDPSPLNQLHRIDGSTFLNHSATTNKTLDLWRMFFSLAVRFSPGYVPKLSTMQTIQ